LKVAKRKFGKRALQRDDWRHYVEIGTTVTDTGYGRYVFHICIISALTHTFLTRNCLK